ncbi:hypothetical protein L208DRAFT_1420110 [Tricholoma matsutake]|nr:hypothetical protein L208DRAFT_1420110 [Tricholoma matsutake 945]
MGVAVKSKWKITHTDLYSGGERSGKKAKPDARSILNRLCKYYGVKAKGTNEDITLSAIVYPPPPSQTLCPTL